MPTSSTSRVNLRLKFKQSAMIGEGSLLSRKYDAGEGVAAKVQS
jgi:hypothetical protein